MQIQNQKYYQFLEYKPIWIHQSIISSLSWKAIK